VWLTGIALHPENAGAAAVNVIFFITDQQRGDHLGCVGNPVVKTPNIDKLASEGVLFTKGYVANPTCMPNRSSIMSGQYPNTCVRSFGVNLPNDIPTFSETLRSEGFVTKAIGKMHLNFWFQKVYDEAWSAEFIPGWRNPETHKTMVEDFPLPFYGFDDVDLLVGHGDVCAGHYQDWLAERSPETLEELEGLGGAILGDLYRKSPVPEEFYPTSYVTDRAVDFLDRYANGEMGKEPFLLKVSYPDPHHPCTPPGRYFDMYRPEDIELPASFRDVDAVRNHPYLRQRLDLPGLRNMMFRTTEDEEEARGFTAATYGMITMIDDSVGQILRTLDEHGLTDDTLIIYTSDHGDMMGDHGMLLKGWLPFQGVLHIPMIFKAPGVAKAGSVSDALVSSVDIAPTVLNLCGVDPECQPLDMQGLDITPLIKDPSTPLRDCCLVEIDENDNGMDKLRPGSRATAGRLKYLITDRYKLVIYDQVPGYGDLFDLQEGPHEMTNLWNSRPELRAELVERLLFEVVQQQSMYPSKQAMA
jgi:arylsulfatase A-like enzyme